MKQNEVVLSKKDNRNSFLVSCLFNRWVSSYEECCAIVDKAKTSEDVVNAVLNSDTLRGSQIYAELSKDRPDHADRIRRDISGWFATESDAGGLRIGNDAFSVVVPNGEGDGLMHFAVVGKGCFNSDMLNFWTSISGKEINIYDHDCGGEIVGQLSGRYGVYYGYGYVVFEEWA